MERLTKKITGFVPANAQHYRNGENITHKQIINKLGQLEDIEEELGVDLIIYLKMTLGTKVFTKNNDMIGCPNHEDGIFEQQLLCYSYSVNHKCFCLNIMGAKTPIYYVKDYGKTWALTREELL